jgi:hypothetical protein
MSRDSGRETDLGPDCEQGGRERGHNGCDPADEHRETENGSIHGYRNTFGKLSEAFPPDHLNGPGSQ